MTVIIFHWAHLKPKPQLAPNLPDFNSNPRCLQNMVAQITVRTCGGNYKFKLCKAFVYNDGNALKERKKNLHTCATCSELPPNVSTMLFAK